VLVIMHMQQAPTSSLPTEINAGLCELEALLLSSVAASQHGEAAASIRLLLQAGASVYAISSGIGERTALMMACSVSDNVSCVHALLKAGSDPCYQASSDGLTALHFAALAGCTATCLALHDASSGRTLELRGKADGLGATPLIAACVMKQYAVVNLLCELGADVNHASVTSNTPLIVTAASEKHDTLILQFLLQQDGIKVNHRNDSGETALMKAAELGNAAAVDALLQSSADPCITENRGYSTLYCAVAKGHLHVLQLLIQHGADITAATDRSYTLLMQAATCNRSDIAEFLLKEGMSVHAVTDIGYTALLHAATSTSKGTESVRMLLARGADVSARSRGDTTPLHVAANSGQLDRVELLLAAGADVLQCDDTGCTALHTAIYYSHLTLVKLLLEHGADAVLNSMQCSVCERCDQLSAVMMCNDSAILKLLLTAGGDVHAVTSSGDACLHGAARHNYSAPVVCLLIKAGADMHAVNSAGKTAAQLAHDAGNTLLEQLLIRAAQQVQLT
jgi:uncharacterized protein